MLSSTAAYLLPAQAASGTALALALGYLTVDRGTLGQGFRSGEATPRILGLEWLSSNRQAAGWCETSKKTDFVGSRDNFGTSYRSEHERPYVIHN